MGDGRILKEIIIDVTPHESTESNLECTNQVERVDEGLNGFQLVGVPYYPSEYTIVSTLPHPYL